MASFGIQESPILGGIPPAWDPGKYRVFVPPERSPGIPPMMRSPGSLDIGGIPTPGDFLPGGQYSQILGYAALAYGGINALKGRRNIMTLAALAYGVWTTGILNNFFPKNSDGSVDFVSTATAVALPATAAGLMYGAGGLALSWIGKKLLSRPKRRRTTYRRRYTSYRRRTYRRR